MNLTREEAVENARMGMLKAIHTTPSGPTNEEKKQAVTKAIKEMFESQSSSVSVYVNDSNCKNKKYCVMASVMFWHNGRSLTASTSSYSN